MANKTSFGTYVGSTSSEVSAKLAMAGRLRTSRVPDDELLDNLGLYLTRQNLSRLLFMAGIFQLILPVHGSIVEFGVRWGQNLSVFSNLRGAFEPYNYNRLMIGFDTFEGFPGVSPQDESANTQWESGDYGVPIGYREELEKILAFHENNAPIAHKRKFSLEQGDASITLPAYLERHPETIIALAYFDFDLYAPTRACLEAIKPHLTKGSVVAFDELNVAEFPGETIALRETLGLSSFALKRSPISPLTSYLVID